MKKQFADITEINNEMLYNKVLAYQESLIKEATGNGALDAPDADNEYTQEIGRIGVMCASYETNYMKFEHIRFKTPLQESIERELEARHLKQKQAAELLDVKESTFSQIITGKRPVSMQMAKKLYKVFNIDPKLILEYS
ncbi:MAG: helix-turn-helix domain-containing protein [Tannerellaceae bacterium]|jgi:predicted XRE-type DNA-binding protein|nr:helix-turn-helix domain-containing protein [Tannerellaceae bacterium]